MAAPLHIWPTVALIGHPAYLLEPAARRWVHRELLRAAPRLRDVHGMTCGTSGMTRGPGLWWADAVRRAHVDLRLHVPHPRQADTWPDADRAEWLRLMGQASRAPLVYGAASHPRAVAACHRAMVDEADELLVVWLPGARGQVGDAIRYALTRGKYPTWIDPANQWIHRPTIGQWHDLLPDPAEPPAAPVRARTTRNRRETQADPGRVANNGPHQRPPGGSRSRPTLPPADRPRGPAR